MAQMRHPTWSLALWAQHCHVENIALHTKVSCGFEINAFHWYPMRSSLVRISKSMTALHSSHQRVPNHLAIIQATWPC